MFLLGFLFFFFEGLSAQTGGNIYDVSCYNKYDKGVTYNGTVSRGFFHDQQKTCINWKTNNSPFTPYYPDHNYCRNPRPDAFKAPWCYIGDNFQTGICNIPVCDCRNSTFDLKYNGSIYTTRNGNTCLLWKKTSIYRNQTANYCRTPPNDGDNAGGPWCYVVSGWGRCNIPVCGGSVCPDLSTYHLLTMDKKSKYQYGEIAIVVSCQKGYRHIEKTYLECTSTGTWNDTMPTCEAVKCKSLNLDSHVKSFIKLPKYNDLVTLSCEEGYIAKPSHIKCDTQGNWPLDRPNCIAVPCPALSNTKHMKQPINHSGYHYGDIITFQCVNGYILSGPPFITCRSTRNHSIGYWSDQPPLCAAVTCQALRPVHHQKLEPDQIKYSYRDNVTFKCNDGYELTTEYIKTTCLSDGTWNNKQPNCTEKSLSYKDSMKNRGKGISYELFGGILAAIVSISAGLQIATCFYYRKRAGKSATVYEDMKFNTVERPITSNEDTYSELT